MILTDSPTFCPSPWSCLRLGTGGGVGVCPYSKDVGSTFDTPMNDIIYGKTLTDVRETMSRGEWHPNCFYCEGSESKGGRSQRLMNLDWMTEDLKNSINADPTQFSLKDCSINWSNLCNLACNYCTPEISTGWQTALGNTIKVSSMGDASMSWLIENSDNLTSIMIGGGEPLLHKNVNDLLEQLKQQRVNVYVTTNLSVDLETNPMFNTVKNNPNLFVIWSISFDGLGDKFEYVRHGAKWDMFVKNIETLKKYNQISQAHPVYGVYCAFDLVEYVDFCVDLGLNIFWCDVYKPKELDIRYAPTALRKLAVQNIDAVLEKYENKNLVMDLSLQTLHKYREMAVTGIHFDLYGNHSDTIKAINILEFNKKIEQQLPKEKLYAELWPEIHDILSQVSKK
jgi:MoaA/NifB/PqqE/SkfB family radical SAM enzyme